MANLIFEDGDLLESDCPCIMHQVNCMGVMGSGVAFQIREKWPVVYEKYKEYCGHKSPEELIGHMLPVKTNDGKIVLNLFGQLNFGYDKHRYTDYSALRTALQSASAYINENGFSRVALPKNMSCCRGGGEWAEVLHIIKETFTDNDITIEIIEYRPEK